jgi:hypothetical protein
VHYLRQRSVIVPDGVLLAMANSRPLNSQINVKDQSILYNITLPSQLYLVRDQHDTCSSGTGKV